MEDEVIAGKGHETTGRVRTVNFMTSKGIANSDRCDIRFAEELMGSITKEMTFGENRVEGGMVADVFNFIGRVVVKGANELVELGSHLGHTSL